MGAQTMYLDDQLYEYLVDISIREPTALRQLREASAALDDQHHRQISREQAQLMTLLARLASTTRVLEIGTFRGYSALALALAIPEGGRVVTCDVEIDGVEFGQRFWKLAGVEDKIDFRLGPASETINALLAGGEHGSYDFAFIDADKRNHDAYYERALQLVHPGGVIVLDNVFWEGLVLDPSQRDEDTEAIRALNRKLRNDERIDISTLPLSDGVTIARVR
jgi:predicted O-methyltransferase YrrM